MFFACLGHMLLCFIIAAGLGFCSSKLWVALSQGDALVGGCSDEPFSASTNSCWCSVGIFKFVSVACPLLIYERALCNSAQHLPTAMSSNGMRLLKYSTDFPIRAPWDVPFTLPTTRYLAAICRCLLYVAKLMFVRILAVFGRSLIAPIRISRTCIALQSLIMASWGFPFLCFRH